MHVSDAVTGAMIGSPSGSMHDVQNRIMSPVHSQGENHTCVANVCYDFVTWLCWHRHYVLGLSVRRAHSSTQIL